MSLAGLIASKSGRICERKGYTVAATWRIPEIVMGRHLRRLFDRLSIDCVLDVGANEGQYAKFLRHHVDYRGPILSFEPISELVEKLKAQASTDPQWSLHRLALGDQSGQADINVMQRTDFSSFCQPSVKVTGELSELNPIVRTETVPVKTLAEIMPELKRQYGFRRPYLKIDTQGHDLAVGYG